MNGSGGGTVKAGLADASPNCSALQGLKEHNDTRRKARVIHHISAVTFAVRDLARSVEFYQKLGFELVDGDERAAFSSLKAREAFVNLSASPEYQHRWWGQTPRATTSCVQQGRRRNLAACSSKIGFRRKLIFLARRDGSKKLNVSA
jgi:hypothetical protein